MNKVALFDWGDVFVYYHGTLDLMADYMKVDRKALAQCVQEDLYLYETGKLDTGQWLMRIARTFPREFDVDELIKFFYEAYKKAAELDEEMLAMFNEIKTKIGWCAVLSNINPMSATVLKEKFPGFYDSFPYKYFSYEIGRVKPDLQAWRIVLDDMHVAPQDVIYIDDRMENNVAAQQLLINTFHFDRNVEDIIEKTKTRLLQFFI